MTMCSFLAPRVRRRSIPATLLAAVIAACSGAAAFAQEESGESEEKERSVRVMVLGNGQVDIEEDPDDPRVLAVQVAASPQELAGRVRPGLALHWGGAWLGVELVSLNEPLRAHFGVPEGSGVLISNVVDGSPAARAGLEVGDIVTRFDGRDVTSSRKLTLMVRKAEAGAPADLEVWRGGKVQTMTATLDERPRPALGSESFVVLRGREDLDGDGEVDVFVSPENIHETIQEYFDGDEWRERHERVQRFLHERRPDMKALEERLESLKKRLAELESRLEKKGADEEQ